MYDVRVWLARSQKKVRARGKVEKDVTVGATTDPSWLSETSVAGNRNESLRAGVDSHAH